MGPKPRMQTVVAICPDCGGKISLRGAIRRRWRVICNNCEAELEVIETDPVELDWVYQEPEEEQEDILVRW